MSNGNRGRETPKPIPNLEAKPVHDMCVLPTAGKHIAVWHLFCAEPMESRKPLINTIARERIEILFGLAEKAFPEDGELASSYVSIMNRIRTHYKVGLPPRIENRVCKGCSSVLMPGYNCKVVLASSKGHIIYKCGECGSERHLNYKH